MVSTVCTSDFLLITFTLSKKGNIRNEAEKEGGHLQTFATKLLQ